MFQLDTLTLWTAAAVLHGFAAMVWALLGGFYRIAPRASLLFSLAELLRIPGLRCEGCDAQWLGEGTELAHGALTLLALLLTLWGILRLLHLTLSGAPLKLGGAAAVTLVLLSQLFGGAESPEAALEAGSAAMSAVLCLVLWRHGLDKHNTGKRLRLAIALPFGLLALVEIGDTGLLSAAGLDSAENWLALGETGLHVWTALNLMVVAVHRVWLKINHLSLHDALTGTLNRRALDERIQHAQDRRQRGEGYAWIALDIDHFKRINDELGHAGGDAALQHVASVLSSELREVDALVRMGGEEFGLLLPNTDLAGAINLAERLRQSLAEQPLQWQGHRWPLSASFGVTHATAEGASDAQTLLQKADQLLYQAKQGGRNCVCADTVEAPRA